MHGCVVTKAEQTSPSRYFRWLVRWWRDYVSTRQTERALASLDDPALKDLGLSRSMIPHVANSTSGCSGLSKEWIIPSKYY